jgi:hypothetical protein
MVRISAEEVESAVKARQQALAEEMENNPEVQPDVEEAEIQEEEGSEADLDAENSAD